MAKIRNYKYVIGLDAATWPRRLADELMSNADLAPHLVSVTDLQDDSHVYGETYTIAGRHGRQHDGAAKLGQFLLVKRILRG